MKRDTPIIVRSLPNSGILYIRSSHSDNFVMDFDIWNFKKICWIESGEGKLEFHEFSMTFKQGDILTIPENVPHRFVDQTPSTLSIICYDEKAIPVTSQKLHSDFLSELPTGTSLTINDPWRRNHLHQFFKTNLIEQSNRHLGYEEILRSNLVAIIIFIYRALKNKDDSKNTNQNIIEGLVNYLEQNFTNVLSVDELAEMCNMSSRSLSRHFKETTGQTIVQKITDLRIAYACERMKETQQITFSALDAGFNDISFFYRVFKKHKGMTPKEFIANR